MSDPGYIYEGEVPISDERMYGFMEWACMDLGIKSPCVPLQGPMSIYGSKALFKNHLVPYFHNTNFRQKVVGPFLPQI